MLSDFLTGITMEQAPLSIGGKAFLRSGKTYICGILNVTPDSFSDGGKWLGMENALRHAGEMVRDGVDLIDVGGESTRPGYTEITEDEEIARVVPVIEALKSRFDVPISLDTYKSAVAQAGIRAGADMINDIWGLRYDDGAMVRTIAESGLPCCLMHNGRRISDGDICGRMCADLAETLELAQRAGIGRDRIILDPGIGFAKNYEQNLRAIRDVKKLRETFDLPVLLGCSRKSVIGTTLDLPVTERLEGTLAATVWAVLQGCTFVRVHDVRENVRAVRMTEAIIYA